MHDHPDSRLANEATLRLGESCFVRREYDSAIACFGRFDARQGRVAEERLLGIALFHKGEAFYHLAKYDKALEAFFDYAEQVDKGRITRGDLRQEAILYMGQCFAEFPASYRDAQEFFSKAGPRRYEDTLFYEIAMKHFDREQYDQAVGAFGHLLENWPGYRKAPMVQLDLVTALVKLHRDDQARAVKEVLMARYGAGAAWWNAAPPLEPRDRKRLDEAIAGFRLERSWK